MRSTQLDLQKYDTDKVANRYLGWYDQLVGESWPQVTAVLELGVHRGGPLELWRDYFPEAQIVPGRQDDEAFLHETARRFAPGGFDLIIEDATGYLGDWPDGKKPSRWRSRSHEAGMVGSPGAW